VVAGGSNELDAAWSAQSKSYSYFGSSGRLLVESMIAFQISYFVLDMKKEHSDDISGRRVLQTK
jgi:hypothetical protein